MDLTRWDAMLNDARSDSEDAETNAKVAEVLGMEPLPSIYDTLCAYVRGTAGTAPTRTGMTIDRLHRELLVRDGVNPARFLRASQLGHGFGLWLTRGEAWTERSTIDDEFAPRVTGVTPLARGMRYDTTDGESVCVRYDTAVAGRLPDTVLECLAGQPLSRLVEHGMSRDPMITGVADLGTDVVVDLGGCESVPLQGE